MLIDKRYIMELNYTLEGEGETLVFIHGLSDSLLYWQPLINNLKSHYQILRYDLRGHGLSEAGDEKVSMDIYVEDLLSLLDELELKKVNIVGFSLGGAIALNFISKYPERVSSLVLMSSFYKSDEHLTKVFITLKNALEKSFTDFYDMILSMVL
jgi:pimeloyl-ACP methyl ester carboxylesterase